MALFLASGVWADSTLDPAEAPTLARSVTAPSVAGPALKARALLVAAIFDRVKP